MAVPTESWSELTPAGSDQINAGDNRIRQAKTQIREVIDVDHNFPSSGSSATTGFHNQMTLIESADIGTGAEGLPILGAQTISSKPELVYTDEDNNDIQITSNGKLHAPSLGGIYPASSVGVLATMMNFIYPVGSIYANYSNANNPATYLGIGTWVAIEGEVIAGYKSGDANFGTAGTTVGVASVTLTAAQSGVPAHTHPQTGASRSPSGGGSPENYSASQNTGNTGISTASNTAADAAEAHTNIQPSFVCYLWRRSA